MSGSVGALAHLAGAAALDVPTSFGRDGILLIVVKVLCVFLALVVATLFTIVAERKVVGRMQQRIGPNRVGPFGSLQSLADGVKLMLKEDIIPALADKPVFLLAPVASAVPAFLAFSVVPFGPSVSVAGHRTVLQLTDFPVSVLFILAMSSLGVYGIVLSGWSSGSTYPLLGSLRSAAQLISYEVALGLALVPVFLYAGTLSTSGVLAAQHQRWYIITLFPSFVIYAIAGVGETNRAPFDLPEAETELVGGFHTEYSSIKFALFFLAEYINLVTVSALATTLFLGGWLPPWPFSRVHALSTGWFPLVWFIGKVLIFVFGFIWLRGTLPRLRYDQFMAFGWKLLVPFGLLWIMVVATIRSYSLQSRSDQTPYYYVFGAMVGVALVGLLFDPATFRRRPEPDSDASDGAEAAVPPAPSPPSPFAVTLPQTLLGRAVIPVTAGAGRSTDSPAGASSAAAAPASAEREV